jgi:hypothetical protein
MLVTVEAARTANVEADPRATGAGPADDVKALTAVTPS